MEIAGFLGTRADIIIDVVMVASALLPFYMIYAFRMAAKGKLALHKKLQIVGLVAVTALVLLLEGDIRFSNLSGISAQSPYHGSATLQWVFIVHLFFAVTTFVGWIWLVVKSSKIYPKSFGTFNHKKWGKLLFLDIIMTGITGWIMYYLVFAY